MTYEAAIIKQCMKEKGISQTDVANEMGEDRRLLNVQLMQMGSMKVMRFKEVLEYLGYRLEIVDNGGVRRVSKETGDRMLVGEGDDGKAWFEDEDGAFVAVEKADAKIRFKKFTDRGECVEYLLK